MSRNEWNPTPANTAVLAGCDGQFAIAGMFVNVPLANANSPASGHRPPAAPQTLFP